MGCYCSLQDLHKNQTTPFYCWIVHYTCSTLALCCTPKAAFKGPDQWYFIFLFFNKQIPLKDKKKNEKKPHSTEFILLTSAACVATACSICLRATGLRCHPKTIKSTWNSHTIGWYSSLFWKTKKKQKTKQIKKQLSSIFLWTSAPRWACATEHAGGGLLCFASLTSDEDKKLPGVGCN